MNEYQISKSCAGELKKVASEYNPKTKSDFLSQLCPQIVILMPEMDSLFLLGK